MDIALPAGTLSYTEHGDGPPVVLVHGFAVNGQHWEPMAKLLAEQGFRVIVPTLPFGSHRTPMRPGTDLTPPGAAALVNDFLAALELTDVTLVGNDSGGAICQVLVTTDPTRVGRLVLTNCDSFENFPPGVFKLLSRLCRLPGAGAALAGVLRFELGLRSPIAYGALTAKPIPLDLLRSFTEPLVNDRAVRADAIAMFGSVHNRYTLAAAEKLPDLDLPTALVWGEDDTFFTIADAERLHRTIPGSTLVRVPDAKTYVMLDQPKAVADAIASFVSLQIS